VGQVDRKQGQVPLVPVAQLSTANMGFDAASPLVAKMAEDMVEQTFESIPRKKIRMKGVLGIEPIPFAQMTGSGGTGVVSTLSHMLQLMTDDTQGGDSPVIGGACPGGPRTSPMTSRQRRAPQQQYPDRQRFVRNHCDGLRSFSPLKIHSN
jgi:hypothetical protein